MQSRNFRLQKVGNLKWLENHYKFQQIAFSLDELIILDATKTQKSIQNFAAAVEKLVSDVFIPVAAGGGIRSIEDAELLFNSGADKIVLNTLLIENSSEVENIVKTYGSQSVVASIDYKINNGIPEPYINNGTIKVNLTMEAYLKYINSLHVGEIYLNSIEQDGTGFGYDYQNITALEKEIQLPLIIAGGAGNEKHLVDGLKLNGVSAVATANLFNFIGDGLPNARKHIFESGENIANWHVSRDI